MKAAAAAMGEIETELKANNSDLAALQRNIPVNPPPAELPPFQTADCEKITEDNWYQCGQEM
jgi:hypothetical protein